MNWLRDETGKASAARILLLLVTAHVLLFGWLHVLLVRPLSDTLLKVLETMIVVMVAWAGGPRLTQHIMPGFKKVAARLTGKSVEPNVYEDDERG